MGTYRVQASAIQTQSGGYTLFSTPSGLTLLQIINTYPLNASNFWRGDSSGSIILLPDSSGIFLDGSINPISENNLPVGFNITSAQLNQSAMANGDLSASWTLKVGALTSAINAATLNYASPITLNGVLSTTYGINQIANPGVSNILGNYTQILGNYGIIDSSWVLSNLTHPSLGSKFIAGDIGQITGTNLNLTTITSIIFWSIVTITTFQTQTPSSITFQVPTNINLNPAQSPTGPVTVTGTTFSGDAFVGMNSVYLADSSGIYSIIPGQTHDTIYLNVGSNIKANVVIPNQFFKTGYIGG